MKRRYAELAAHPWLMHGSIYVSGLTKWVGCHRRPFAGNWEPSRSDLVHLFLVPVLVPISPLPSPEPVLLVWLVGLDWSAIPGDERPEHPDRLQVSLRGNM